ncbi:hypothetical protein HanRHA438_Chr05g0208121 [Helianthus annuus]|nr:hypothetical protein HanRHA438_Chr05g0208121 [Helianthus annuus]
MCEPPLCAVAPDHRMQRRLLRQTIAITGGRTTAMKHRRNPPWKRVWWFSTTAPYRSDNACHIWSNTRSTKTTKAQILIPKRKKSNLTKKATDGHHRHFCNSQSPAGNSSISSLNASGWPYSGFCDSHWSFRLGNPPECRNLETTTVTVAVTTTMGGRSETWPVFPSPPLPSLSLSVHRCFLYRLPRQNHPTNITAKRVASRTTTLPFSPPLTCLSLTLLSNPSLCVHTAKK